MRGRDHVYVYMMLKEGLSLTLVQPCFESLFRITM